jgi:hypothetical protein
MTMSEAVTTKVVSSVWGEREFLRFSGWSGAGIWDNNAMLVGVGASAMCGASRSVATFTGQRSCPHAQTVVDTRSHVTMTAYKGIFVFKLCMVLSSGTRWGLTLSHARIGQAIVVHQRGDNHVFRA